MRLEFDAENHEYRIDGKIVPSVTQLCAPLTAQDLANLNPAVLQQAAQRGTIVHELTELIDYGTAPEDIETYAELGGYITAYLRFLRDYKPEWEKIEYRVGEQYMHFAGTIDRIGVIDGRRCIVDIKTSSAVNRVTKVAWVTQLSGYRVLICDATVDRYILRLKPDGTYTLYDAKEIEKEYKFFGARLFAHLLEQYEILKGA